MSSSDFEFKSKEGIKNKRHKIISFFDKFYFETDNIH